MIDDWLFMHLCESYIPTTTFENNDHLSFDRLFVSKDQYNLGRVLLGLFRNRNTQNRPVFVFFWELFRFWNKRNIIPFILPAPDSKMNRIKGMRFTRNRQNMRSFGIFLAGNPSRPLAPVPAGRRCSSQVTSSMGIPFPD